MGKNLTKNDKDYILDRFYIENISYISKKLGVSVFDVWNFAETNGLTAYLTDMELRKKVENLANMYNEKNINVNAIAETLGIPSNCAKDILRINGNLKTRLWEDYEFDILKDYYGKVHIRELEKVLYLRTRQSINRKASLLGLTEEKRRVWTNEELEYIRDNYGVIPTKEIAEHLGRSESAVTISAVRVGKTIKGKNHIYTEEDEAVVRKHINSMSVAEMHKLFFPDVTYSSFNYFCKKIKGEYVLKKKTPKPVKANG